MPAQRAEAGPRSFHKAPAPMCPRAEGKEGGGGGGGLRMKHKDKDYDERRHFMILWCNADT